MSTNSATYRCPHCDQVQRHRAHLSGAKVQCRSCGDFYFEPDDLLPGSHATKVETQESTAHEGEIDWNAISAAITHSETAESPLANPVSESTASLQRESSAPHLADSSGLDLNAPSQLRSSRVLRPFELAGQKATVISWSPHENSGAKVGTTKNCSKEEGNEMILRVALRLIKRRWPELYPLLSNRIDPTSPDRD